MISVRPFGGGIMYLYVNGTLIGTNTYYLGVQTGSENYVGIGWINSMVPIAAAGDYNDFQYSSTLQTYSFFHGLDSTIPKW